MALGESEYFDEQTAKFIRDPVHRADVLLSPYEVRIINTRAFQRMRGIKQLGSCEVVWHCAVHNRFQHAIGTLHMAEEILRNVDPRGVLLKFPQRILVRIFALLHDIGHLPFGHTLEDERPAIRGHHTDRSRVEHLLREEIGQVLTELEEKMGLEDLASLSLPLTIGSGKNRRCITSLPGLLVELICQCRGETDESLAEVPESLRLYQDIVGNTVCADLFDYLRRDAYHTGLRREYDDKIMSDLHIEDGQLVLDLLSDRAGRGGSRTELINLMHVRYSLAERVYFNKTKLWAAAMVSKAVEMADVPAEFLFDKRDDEMLWALEHGGSLGGLLPAEEAAPACPGPDTGEISQALSLEIARLWSDIWRKMKGTARRDLKGASSLIGAYRRRDVFRPVYSAASVSEPPRMVFKKYLHDVGYQPFRAAVEGFIAGMCEVEPWQVVICCPNTKMNLKFANPRIGPFPDHTHTYQHLNDVEHAGTPDADLKLLLDAAAQIRQNHYNLWRFDVVVPMTLPLEVLNRIRGVCQDIFKLENRAKLAGATSENLRSVRARNAQEAYVQVTGRGPSFEEVGAMLGEAEKGPEERGAVRAYFKDDFVAVVKRRLESLGSGGG